MTSIRLRHNGNSVSRCNDCKLDGVCAIQKVFWDVDIDVVIGIVDCMDFDDVENE